MPADYALLDKQSLLFILQITAAELKHVEDLLDSSDGMKFGYRQNAAHCCFAARNLLRAQQHSQGQRLSFNVLLLSQGDKCMVLILQSARSYTSQGQATDQNFTS